ncbi:hypothetical protein ACWGPT_01265 [Pseudorhizobium sp. NPDC055634]
MSGERGRSPALAAAIIFLGFLVLFFVMPPIMIWLAETFSPYLAAAFGVLAVASFFAIFWLRGRYQRGRKP